MQEEQRLTVLIVEDQDDLRSLLLDTMERLGKFRAVGAGDGVEGLEAIMKIHPDCVIIDVLMPQLDGFQLVQLLRGDPATADIPIIILTALAQDAKRFRGMAIGADRYLLKPARPAQLVAAVREVMAISAAQRQAQQAAIAAQEPPRREHP